MIEPHMGPLALQIEGVENPLKSIVLMVVAGHTLSLKGSNLHIATASACE